MKPPYLSLGGGAKSPPYGLLVSNCSRALIKKARTAICEWLITELRIEGLRERQLARFAVDDDVPRVPCPLDSAQSRRSAVGAL